MRFLVLGASGQLGRALSDELAQQATLVAPSHGELDLADGRALSDYLAQHPCDLLVNAAAYTAVDRAEGDRDAAFAINRDAPALLARHAARNDIPLIHFSTDYVFDGHKEEPYLESDSTAPLSVYGASKLAGELAVASSGAPHLILRTSWIYDADGANFMNTMLRLARERETLRVVDDQWGAPTSSYVLARAVGAAVGELMSAPRGQRLRRAERSGVFHMTCAGATSWHGFAQAIFRRVPDPARRMSSLVAIPTREYPTPARRPLNSRLSNQRLARALNLALPDWQVALDEVCERHASGAPAVPR